LRLTIIVVSNSLLLCFFSQYHDIVGALTDVLNVKPIVKCSKNHVSTTFYMYNVLFTINYFLFFHASSSINCFITSICSCAENKENVKPIK